MGTGLFVVLAEALRDAAAALATCFLQVHGSSLDFSSDFSSPKSKKSSMKPRSLKIQPSRHLVARSAGGHSHTSLYRKARSHAPKLSSSVGRVSPFSRLTEFVVIQFRSELL